MYTQIWQRTEVQLWNSGENTAFSINRTGKIGYQCKEKKNTNSKLDSSFTPCSKLYSRWNSKCDEWNSETSGKQMNSVCVCVCVCVCACVYVQLLQSCLTLGNPLDCSVPGSSVHGILQARILHWVAMISSRESSWLRDWTQVTCLLQCSWILYH